MNIYFWQSNISPHQIPYILELAKMGNDVTLIVPKSHQLKFREDSGWSTPDTKGINLIVRPDEKEITAIFETKKSRKSVHCFSGIDFNSMIYSGFKISLNKPVVRVIVAEGPDLRGLRYPIRWLYAKLKYAKYVKYIDLVLAIGQNAAIYYHFMGIDESSIKPFNYCVEDTKNNKLMKAHSNFRAIYLGGLIRRKGVDILCNAYSLLNNDPFQLDIYGGGKEEQKLRSITKKHNLASINFKGIVSNDQIKQIISTYDLLILPSRYDGWGAVLNEALMAGTPVLCSDNCGAKQLIQCELQGVIFKTGSVKDLKNKIQERLQRGTVQNDERKKLIEWSRKIHKSEVAKYFIYSIQNISKR